MISFANSLQTEAELSRLEHYLEQTFYLSERVNAFRKQKLYTMEIELSRRCDLECTYCYNASSHNNDQHADPDRCKDLLNEAAEYGIREIYWLGGEALQFPQIEDLLRHAKNLGLRNVVFTNGSRFTPGNINTLLETTEWISLHLDTIDPEVFRTLHNTKGDLAYKEFQQILAGIDLLLEMGFPADRVRFTMVLTRDSLATLRQTLEWAIWQKRFHSSTLVPLVDLGRARKGYGENSISRLELRQAYQTRAEIEGRPELLRLGPSEFCKHYDLTNCYIDVFGNVFPYVGIPDICGNIYEEKIGDTLVREFDRLSYADSVDRTTFDSHLTGFCGDCENRRFCFGTRTYSYLSGGIHSSDPMCWRNSDND
ncbi:MAG: hypothetical protein A3G18_00780 [Rhodospirillales bacterium RIFCSPLOWO2_12_FULL_58_28]|nr:MAG: hypothetical protein A3H92_12625 [Rhodospirillales bacterium RIFCSPLOWO2_02_FULL_58_16]OHC77059.1 MAG: hypothetical protein A3G18_00780 [Rhodospirillales bacterium RIFCSPLOWO2_12_FULL_58_28]